MSKVFILNLTNRYDFTKAEPFGEPVVVTEGIVPIFKPDIMAKKVHAIINEYREEDYLLISGPAILSMIAITILFNKYDVIQTLVHDARLDTYIPRTLSKSNLVGGL